VRGSTSLNAEGLEEVKTTGYQKETTGMDVLSQTHVVDVYP